MRRMLLLVRLHFLLLRSVLLLKLLSLLSVTLFHLLFLRVTGIFLAPFAGVLFPAVVAASGAPDFVWRLACPAAVDTFCPLQHYRCSSPCTDETELRSHELCVGATFGILAICFPFSGALYGAPASLADTTPPWKSPGFDVAAIGGRP